MIVLKKEVATQHIGGARAWIHSASTGITTCSDYYRGGDGVIRVQTVLAGSECQGKPTINVT